MADHYGNDIRIGDRVMFCAEFLRSTGQLTGDTPTMAGVVSEIRPMGACALIVFWDERLGEFIKAIDKNLQRCPRQDKNLQQYPAPMN